MTKTTKIRSQTHKIPLKTHIEALKIQKFSRGRPPPTPLTRGGIIPPLVLSPRSCLRHSMASSAGPLLNTPRRPCPPGKCVSTQGNDLSKCFIYPGKLMGLLLSWCAGVCDGTGKIEVRIGGGLGF